MREVIYWGENAAEARRGKGEGQRAVRVDFRENNTRDVPVKIRARNTHHEGDIINLDLLQAPPREKLDLWRLRHGR